MNRAAKAVVCVHGALVREDTDSRADRVQGVAAEVEAVRPSVVIGTQDKHRGIPS